jgi:hypothetical protein
MGIIYFTPYFGSHIVFPGNLGQKMALRHGKPFFMSDAGIPDRWGKAAHWWVAAIACFVFFMVAVEDFNEAKIQAGFINLALFAATFVIGVKWNFISNWLQRRNKLVAITLMVAGVILFVAGVALWRRPASQIEPEPANAKQQTSTDVAQVPPSPAVQDTAIFMECQMVPLPLAVEPGKSLNVVVLNKKRMEANKSGFYDVSGSSEDGKWPRKSALEESRKMKNFGTFAYRCRVTNKGPQTIIYLGVPIDVWFGNKGGEENKNRYTAILSGLGPNAVSEFHLVNDCNVHVAAVWQDIAVVQILGETSQRNVPLRRTYSNAIEQVMSFFPTSIRWIGGGPCE